MKNVIRVAKVVGFLGIAVSMAVVGSVLRSAIQYLETRATYRRVCK